MKTTTKGLAASLTIVLTLGFMALALAQMKDGKPMGSDMKGSDMKGSGMKTEMKADMSGALADKGVDATVDGEIICLCYHLNKDLGIKENCENQNALLVKKATGMDGMDIPDLNGTVLHFLRNEKAKGILKGSNMGREIEVKGKVFPKLTLIAPESFKFESKGSTMKGSDMKGSMMKEGPK